MHARCLCGEVGWEAQGPLEQVTHCHCSRCRKTHGTAYATYGSVAANPFHWVADPMGIRRYESSPGFFRCFCGRCGSVVPGDPLEGRVFLPAGSLEGDVDARPLAHIFVGSKAPWFEIADTLPRFNAYPPGIEAPVLGDLGRGGSEEVAGRGPIRGSCLCGGVAWQVEGTLPVMRHCHCLRCRRARSAAHASNGFAAPESFRWTRGEERVLRFKLPEAERFTQAFCPTCGSPVPWLVAARGVMNVPLGALDDDPGGRPSEHIFVGSKAPWHEIADALPQHKAYGAS